MWYSTLTWNEALKADDVNLITTESIVTVAPSITLSLHPYLVDEELFDKKEGAKMWTAEWNKLPNYLWLVWVW